MPAVKIYTDGACSGNPGPGGWAAILVFPDGTRKEVSGGEIETTNNRMEMMAAIQGLSYLQEESLDIDIVTDSAYLSNAFREDWVSNWESNGWKTSKRRDVKNRDLWELLIELDKQLRVSWFWVKGHSENQYNEMADLLAKEARRGYQS